ncbi:MAG: hypothetical protein ACFB20_00060 [Opitutales bacterium]
MTTFAPPPNPRERSTLQVAFLAAVSAGLIGVVLGFYLGYRLASSEPGPSPAPTEETSPSSP